MKTNETDQKAWLEEIAKHSTVMLPAKGPAPPTFTLTTPWRLDDKIVATNGAIIVAVRPSDPNAANAYPPVPSQYEPNITNILKKQPHEREFLVDLQELRTWLNGILAPIHQCPTCNGSGQRACSECDNDGKVDFTCPHCNDEHEADCPDCDGTKQVRCDCSPAQIPIVMYQAFVIDAKLLGLVLAGISVPTATLSINESYLEGIFVYAGPDFEATIMPMNTGFNSQYPHWPTKTPATPANHSHGEKTS